MMASTVDGQISEFERKTLQQLVAETRPAHILEIGTWKGGGSTVEFLRALEEVGEGHLWGIEASSSVYEEMIGNIAQLAPGACHRFSALLGFSQQMIPKLLEERGADFQIGIAFLDGGNNPAEQIDEYRLLAPRIPVGGYLLSHDIVSRKGKWFVPYIQQLDHWEVTLYPPPQGELLKARKIADQPSPESLRKAEALLRKMQRDWFEIASRILPPEARSAIARILPQSAINRFIHGWRK